MSISTGAGAFSGNVTKRIVPSRPQTTQRRGSVRSISGSGASRGVVV